MNSLIAIIDGPVFWAILALVCFTTVPAIGIAIFLLLKKQRTITPQLTIVPPAPGSKIYYFSRSGTNIGSYPEGAVRELISNKQIQAEDDYWTQGMPNWQKVAANPTWR
jgi:GYF domain 2